MNSNYETLLNIRYLNLIRIVVLKKDEEYVLILHNGEKKMMKRYPKEFRKSNRKELQVDLINIHSSYYHHVRKQTGKTLEEFQTDKTYQEVLNFIMNIMQD